MVSQAVVGGGSRPADPERGLQPFDTGVVYAYSRTAVDGGTDGSKVQSSQ